MFCACVVEMEIICFFCLIVSINSSGNTPSGTPVSSGDPQSYWNSAPLVFQNVESFLVLCLKRHDKVVRGDFPPAVLIHLAHEDVVQSW